MATEVLAPRDLEQRCRECHAGALSERATNAYRQIDELIRLRRSLTQARFQIAGIVDAPTRETLVAQWHDADVSVGAVASGFHTFNERRVEDRLSDARAQMTHLAAALDHRQMR